jgi:uncharacterized protein (TIGR00299 family) protein
MKTLYLECTTGAAGDMITAALFELLPDKAAFLEKMNALGRGISVAAERAKSHGIAGTHMAVRVHGAEEHQDEQAHHHAHEHHHEHEHEHDHEHHHHYALAEVRAVIDGLEVPAAVKERAYAVYDTIAQAESRAHGESVEMIHFHEVGALDAVADVVGACYAMHLLAPERVVVSPVCTGFGHVRCAHGLLPVPAPATAFLLEGAPSFAGEMEGELCTPTGAALLRALAQDFGQRPAMTVAQTGIGLGTKDFGNVSCVRAFLGEADEDAADEVTEIVCNLDDMTPEAVSCAMEKLMELGALDVAAVPAAMKKGRPGHMLHVIVRKADEETVARAILRETTTYGLRFLPCRRMKLSYSFDLAQTPYGEVRLKYASGWGVHKVKPEYEDVAELAREAGVPFNEVWLAAMREAK